MNASAMQPYDGTKGDQSWGTPPEFINAFTRRFGPIIWDLAASPHNAVHPQYFTEHENALTQDWAYISKELGPGWLWLNPPYNFMLPWAQKCAEEARNGARIAMLSQTSQAKWFVNYVAPNARVYLTSPRIQFVPAPGQEYRIDKHGKEVKRTGADFDSMLSLFGPATRGSIEVWQWRSPTS